MTARISADSLIGFATASLQRMGMEPAKAEAVADVLVEGELLGPLKDRRLFDAVCLDSEAYTLVWPNGADFDPSNLHDWPEVKDEFAERARTWAAAH